MDNRISFLRVFFIWFVVTLGQLFINGATIRSSLLASFFFASLGIFLVLVPAYPNAFASLWGEKRAKLVIRLLGAAEAVISFYISIF